MDDQLFLRRQLPAVLLVVRHLRRVVEPLLEPGSGGHHKDFGDFALLRLDAGSVHQYQSVNVVVVHRRHFRRYPAAHRRTHQHNILQAQGVDEHMVEVGDVGDGLDPVRAFGAVETGLAGDIDGIVLGQVAVVGLPAVGTAGAVKEHQGRAAAAGVHFYGSPVDIYGSARTASYCGHSIVLCGYWDAPFWYSSRPMSRQRPSSRCPARHLHTPAYPHFVHTVLNHNRHSGAPIVIPAKAGIYGCRFDYRNVGNPPLDSGLRRNDGPGVGMTIADTGMTVETPDDGKGPE